MNLVINTLSYLLVDTKRLPASFRTHTTTSHHHKQATSHLTLVINKSTTPSESEHRERYTKKRYLSSGLKDEFLKLFLWNFVANSKEAARIMEVNNFEDTPGLEIMDTISGLASCQISPDQGEGSVAASSPFRIMIPAPLLQMPSMVPSNQQEPLSVSHYPQNFPQRYD
jgi:hypothetical protein